MKFIVALPMYNEEACAQRSISTLLPILNELDQTAKVVVVDDGSTDRTNQVVSNLVERYGERLVLLAHEKNKGYGGAIKTAYDYAATEDIDYVLFMDADLTQDPKYISDFIPPMNQGCGIIKASRYIAGGRAENVPFFRVVVSWVGNKISKILFRLPLNDYTNGFRAVRADLAKRMNLTSNGFELLIEEIYQAKYLGADFCEVPYVLTARCDEDGCSNFSYSPQIYVKYIKFGIRSFFKRPPKNIK